MKGYAEALTRTQLKSELSNLPWVRRTQMFAVPSMAKAAPAPQ
jgi:hypothetical protein